MRTRPLVITILVLAWTTCSSLAANQPITFTVSPDLLATRPLSPLLYGNFIELGYGIQVEPMWSEQLFNRSFEPFRSYKPINVEWFDLWVDPADHSKGYKTDWSAEEWYHSGYEHNPWFPAPGEGGRLPIDEKSTFILGNSTLANVQLRRAMGGSGHGVQQLRVLNQEARAWGGLGQEGKFLRRGTTYKFRGKFRSPSAGTLKAEVRLYPTGNWKEPIAVAPLKDILGTNWCERTARLSNKSFQGWATFVLWLPPGGDVYVDDFSLMPTENHDGWRTDILPPLREVKPGIIRFPGGCFASFYDWRDGIGNYSERNPQPSWFWGGMNYNDVGVAEYVALCKAIGAEMLWCVNVYHPFKARYEFYWGSEGPPPGRHGYNFEKFTSVEQGARDAADLVAYCNSSQGRNQMSQLRASHGYPLPFGIKYWELDNEVHRWFEPEEYAQAAVAYSKAMKAVDPSIKIGLAIYGERLNTNGQVRLDFHDYLPQMLEIAGRHIDFVADRGPAEKAYLDRIVGALDNYNIENKTSIRYCDTEKLFYERIPTSESAGKQYSKSFAFSKWYYAMNVLKQYMAYQRAGGDVDFVIFNNLANTHGQCVIETPKEGVFITASGLAMSALANSPASWPLKIEGYEPSLKDEFHGSAFWDKSKNRLVLYVLNRTPDEHVALFDYRALPKRFTRAEINTMTADGPFAMVTRKNPLAVRHEARPERKSNFETTHRVTVPPWSFTEMVLQ